MRQNKKHHKPRNSGSRGSVSVFFDKKTRKHRVQVTRSNGTRTSKSFATEAQAESVAAEAREQIENECQTIGEAVEMYIAELGDRDVTDDYIVSVGCHLRLMFPDRDDQHISQLHPDVCKVAYKRVRKLGHSVDYQRNSLITSRSMCKWLVEEGMIGSNPFANIEGKGKGKTQLTKDEARRFLDTCITYEHPARRGDGRNKMRTPKLDPQVGVTAAMTCLLMGLRCSDITRLTPRSLDESGAVLLVNFSKTEAGKRKLEIPVVLRERMPALVAATITRNHISNWAHKVCELADVTDVGPHALRGTHASLARNAGATGPLVSAALGHANTAVTTGHYTDANVTARAEQRSALTSLNWDGRKSAHESAHCAAHRKMKPQGGDLEVSEKPSLLN